jgi:hypothetical protein
MVYGAPYDATGTGASTGGTLIMTGAAMPHVANGLNAVANGFGFV